jgi:hypothetical protein
MNAAGCNDHSQAAYVIGWMKDVERSLMMLRKTMIALAVALAFGFVAPTTASARGGFGGFHGGFHGGGFHGFHGGFHGGGFRHHGFFGPRFGWGLGLGFASPYAFGWGYPYDYYGYPYRYPYGYSSYYDDGGCYLTRRRVHTRHGWRWRRVEVCR